MAKVEIKPVKPPTKFGELDGGDYFWIRSGMLYRKLIFQECISRPRPGGEWAMAVPTGFTVHFDYDEPVRKEYRVLQITSVDGTVV
jgi:hypothetical protein